jgi:hypothetical protein
MDDFIGETVTPLVEFKNLERKTFKPWHKPRKQWCRFGQWQAGLNWVIDNSVVADMVSFKYLGLPGDDLLDLRLFAYGCSSKGVKLKYLGFNSIDEKLSCSNELRLSESELYKTGHIVSGSQVITEPLESLSRKNSSAFMDAKSYRGFHMINFDLCKSIARKGADFTGDTYFTALNNLLEEQVNYMREPWVLFITTNVCKDSVNDDAIIPLLAAIKDNNDAYPSFSAGLVDSLSINPAQIENAIVDLSVLSDTEFFDVFALGFSKWLLKICLSISSAWNIEMTSSCKYRTGNDEGEADMLSLAFKFDYVHQQANDPYKLAVTQGGGGNRTELDFALSMVAEVGKIFNLDSKLQENDQLMGTLTQHSADLLASARYEKEDYFQWVEDGCPC